MKAVLNLKDYLNLGAVVAETGESASELAEVLKEALQTHSALRTAWNAYRTALSQKFGENLFDRLGVQCWISAPLTASHADPRNDAVRMLAIPFASILKTATQSDVLLQPVDWISDARDLVLWIEPRSSVAIKAEIDRSHRLLQVVTTPIGGGVKVNEFRRILAMSPDDVAAEAGRKDDGLSAAECRQIGETFEQAASIITASELIDGKITVSKVNQCFRKLAGMPLDNSTKIAVAELAQSLRKSGATLKYGSQECTLSTEFVKRTGKRRFVVLSAGSDQRPLAHRVNLPPELNFEK